MLWNHKELSQYFSEETVHVLDYDCEYDRGYQDAEKFPEFQNKVIFLLSGM